ncbi:hypothetical protein [Rhizobium laguerreae]|uniref:hypothetical protein n=1 Tax=Rhizobium laguerreae TaxID=1076926 RepID=UPI001C926D17|nr:hypothetical protein [Rhizobium laguerreae]MBY3038927.1 hypothetical protein [Rhizobium laguerreae]
MTLKHRWLGSTAILFNAEGGGSGGGTGGETSASPESILFPSEGTTPPADSSAENGTKTEENAAADDWKEYENDPAKSAEENATLKAAHDATKPKEGDGKPPADPLDTVPEDGKYALTMPEGVEVDQELVDALGADFKGMGLTTRQAQTLADKFIEIQTARGKASAEGWANRVQGWADDAKKDKEIGGDKWTDTVSSAHRTLSKLGTPGLREYLNASGGGNHPELIRIFAKVGSLIQEDNPPGGGAGGDGRKADPAHVLFPNDIPKGK